MGFLKILLLNGIFNMILIRKEAPFSGAFFIFVPQNLPLKQ